MMNWGRFALILLFGLNCVVLGSDLTWGNSGWWLELDIIGVVALGLFNYAACHS